MQVPQQQDNICQRCAGIAIKRRSKLQDDKFKATSTGPAMTQT
jgi:hypothetical protein